MLQIRTMSTTTSAKKWNCDFDRAKHVYWKGSGKYIYWKGSGKIDSRIWSIKGSWEKGCADCIEFLKWNGYRFSGKTECVNKGIFGMWLVADDCQRIPGPTPLDKALKKKRPGLNSNNWKDVLLKYKDGADAHSSTTELLWRSDSTAPLLACSLLSTHGSISQRRAPEN